MSCSQAHSFTLAEDSWESVKRCYDTLWLMFCTVWFSNILALECKAIIFLFFNECQTLQRTWLNTNKHTPDKKTSHSFFCFLPVSFHICPTQVKHHSTKYYFELDKQQLPLLLLCLYLVHVVKTKLTHSYYASDKINSSLMTLKDVSCGGGWMWSIWTLVNSIDLCG